MIQNKTDKPACQHDAVWLNTTVEVIYHKAFKMWWASCRVCHQCTDACLTREEAVARANVGWWAK